METNTKDIDRAVIVGGGLIGVEMAEMLRTRGIEVTFLIREKEFWDAVLPSEEAKLVGRHIVEHHIDLRKQTELKEINAGEDGRVKGVTTNTGEFVPCQYVGSDRGGKPECRFSKILRTGNQQREY